MKEGESSTMRFLPMEMQTTLSWKERLLIKLPVAGVKGETDSPVQVQIPVWKCTARHVTFLMKYVAGLKIPSLEDMGLKYWKKRSYIFQGFVTDNPLQEDRTRKSQS